MFPTFQGFKVQNNLGFQGSALKLCDRVQGLRHGSRNLSRRIQRIEMLELLGVSCASENLLF